MGITVITSTFNSVKEINLNIKNIADLKLVLPIQWIVIDGDSSDGTKELLQEHIGKEIDVFLTEKDDGIYDAWNKAIRYITYDWVVFMGAGDEMLCDGVKEVLYHLRKINANLNHVVHCNVSIVDEQRVVIKTFEGFDNTDYSNGRPPLPCHQGVFCNANLFKTLSGFDTSYKIAGDSKFLFQASKIANFEYLDVFVCNMLNGGVSTSAKSALETMNEILRLNRELKLRVPLLYRIKFWLRMRSKSLLFRLFGDSGVEFVKKSFISW